jgi:hypothetical protein
MWTDPQHQPLLSYVAHTRHHRRSEEGIRARYPTTPSPERKKANDDEWEQRVERLRVERLGGREWRARYLRENPTEALQELYNLLPHCSVDSIKTKITAINPPRFFVFSYITHSFYEPVDNDTGVRFYYVPPADFETVKKLLKPYVVVFPPVNDTAKLVVEDINKK